MNKEQLQAKLDEQRVYAFSNRRNNNRLKAYARGYLGMPNLSAPVDAPFDEDTDPVIDYLDGVIDYLADEALVLHEARCDAADERARIAWYRPGGAADILAGRV